MRIEIGTARRLLSGVACALVVGGAGALVPGDLGAQEARAHMEAQLEEARAAYEADPDDADAIIWLGRRTAYLGRYREAVGIYTEGIRKHPEEPRMYRHRGHRWITLREFDRAIRDLERAAELIRGRSDRVEPDGMPNEAGIPRSTLHSNIWYHLALARYLKGDFEGALPAWRACMEVSGNDDMRVATADWLYMTLRRLGREEEAARVLEPIRAEMEILENHAYHRRLLMYKGEVEPDALLDLREDDPVQVATYGYGVGNWYLYNGDIERAERIFRRILEGSGTAAFGYIAAEVDVARLEAAGGEEATEEARPGERGRGEDDRPEGGPAGWPLLPAEAPAGEGRVRPCELEGALGSARCGTFRVFEDREARSGRTLDLAFVVLDALEREGRRDVVVPLPGGPGEAFLGAAAVLSRRLPREVRRTRDILLVDVRGVGWSGTLDCTVPVPGGLASRFGTLFPLEHATACRDALAARAGLDRYTTDASVDDLEELRRWLGYDAVNLVGGSYGTRVAQVYLRRHPAAVRTAVLNGVAPLDVPNYVYHARFLQRALDRLVEECLDDSACGAAYPDLEADLERLLARFRSGPVEVDLEAGTFRFHAGDLAYALRGLLYGGAEELPAIVTRAARGEEQAVRALAAYYLQRSGWVSEPGGEAGYHFSVLCAEDIARVTDEQARDATAGTFMGDHLIRAYREVCASWPHANLPASWFAPVRSEVPTLLLSGGRDPVTPPEWAERVATHLPDHLHVVVPNGAHGVGGPCIEAMIAELVESASLDGLDPSCVETAPPTRFRVEGP